MKKDSLYGPPKEVLDVELPNGKKSKKVKAQTTMTKDLDEFIDDDEKLKQGYNSAQLRKYEV